MKNNPFLAGKLPGRALCIFSSLAFVAAEAENWPNWRGPHFDGSSTETSLPTEFSKTENVKWVTPMPGASAATPVVWAEHIFVSSTEDSSKTLHALGFDRKTGKLLWNQEVASGFKQDDKSDYASP